MTSPDDLLSGATDELRDQLDSSPIPDFRPTRRVSPVVAIAALVVGLGVGTAVARLGGDDATLETVVATEPDSPLVESDPANPTSEPEASPEPIANEVARRVYIEPERLTNAAPGEFIAPLPGVSAFNADESLVLLYRTGSAGPDHVIVDTSTGAVVREMSIDSPDIEHVYWNPLIADELVWLSGTTFMRVDVRTGARSEYQSGCDSATTGRYASPPSQNGMFAIACERAESWSIDLVDVTGGSSITKVRDPDAVAGIEAMRVSPTGRLIAMSYTTAPDTIVLDLTGPADTTNPSEAARIRTEGAVVTWVALSDGTEAIVLSGYNDVGPGTIVVVTPGQDPVVVVGPDAGDEYPPSRTGLSASTRAGETPRIVAATRGPATGDSVLTGQVIIADVPVLGPGPGADSIDVFDHNGADVNDYWSANTISVSPSGERLVWATDDGTDSTNTYIYDLPALDRPG